MDSVFQFTRRFNEKINDRLHRQNKENAGKDFLGAKKTMFYGAIGLILLAVILFFSLTASLFRVPDLASPLGDFFTDSYGVLSFVVPIYLLCAAFILFDSGYKPERIFILNTTILPFFTLSIGFSFIRDFAYYESKFSFLSILGKNGFSFLMVFLTVMESLLIASLTKSLFPNSVKVRERQQFQSGIKQNVQSTQNFSQHVCEPQPFDILKHNSGTNNFEQSQDAAMFTKPSLNTLHYEPIDFDKEIRIVPYTPENLPVQNILSQAGLMEVEQVYNEAFKELQDLETSTEIDHLFGKLDPGMSTLNTQLEFLGSGLEDLDAKFEKFETNLQNLKNELTSFDKVKKTNFPDTLHNFSDLDDLNGVDLLDPVSDCIDEFDEVDDADEVSMFEDVTEDAVEDVIEEIPEFSIVEDNTNVANIKKQNIEDTDLEEIISKSEQAAAINTDLSIKKNYTASRKPDLKKKDKLYSVPVEGILKQYEDGEYWIVDDATRQAARVLKETLNEFKIQAEVTGIRKGPVITMFEILPSPGVKLSKIVNLQDNIALRLAASSVRIVAPIPGKHAVGIEIPNKKRNIVSFREIIEGCLAQEEKKQGIPIVLGKDITGEAVTTDLAAMPHLLIAGSTGSGKSVCVNTLILSILYQCHPTQCKMILIDPKIVELKLYNGIPHLLTPVITEPKKAFQALQYCICEMERRYACLDSLGVRDIKTYNKRIKERGLAQEKMPYIVVVIDEFADLMATTGKELESTVARLAAMSRAVGIHLVLATQRPSIDIITGLIKSNIPSRIAFMVASMMDSRIIIDCAGAEKLLGKGDMLYSGAVDPFPVRMQGAFVSEEEVEAAVAYVKNTFGEPDYIDDEIFFEEDDEDTSTSIYTEGDDPLYEKALDIVSQQGKASASYIQRRLKIGYNRAARLVEEMEQRGVVGPAQGSKPRELLRAV